jgi:glycosyltransferase involved in cell wall biosynthesis
MTSQPLNLAIDVGPLYGHRTGVGMAVSGIVDALSRRDDVTVDRYLISLRAKPRAGDRKLAIPGIVASHLWARTDRPRHWLRHNDVVHGTNYVIPPGTVPSVISVYDCWFLKNPALMTPTAQRVGATLKRAVARGAWVHASSEATAHDVAELLRTDRIATVLLGPPPSPPDRSSAHVPGFARELGDRPVILAIGTEERRKDLGLLIESFANLHPSVPDAVLVLAGAHGNESEMLTTSIAALPDWTRANVLRLGPIDDPTKHWLLDRASVLAYPSLDEGFGFPILEAQAAGTPVVARRSGAIPEIAGSGAVLVDDRDVEQFAAALELTISNDENRTRLIDAGRQNTARFSWDQTATDLVDLYARAMESQS